MSCRMITPYNAWPGHEYLESLETAYEGQDLPAQPTQKEEQSSAKKAKSKKRRSRTKSTGIMPVIANNLNQSTPHHCYFVPLGLVFPVLGLL